MMIKVHILTKGLRSYNGIAFLTPLIRWRKTLRTLGVDIVFFTRLCKRLSDCDVLILDSKFFVSAWQNSDALFAQLTTLKKNNQVYFFDLGDSSSSWVLGVLPYVDRLYKSYLLKDKTLYTKPLYGGRLWTDYYHQNFAIEDSGNNQLPQFYANPQDLEKIKLGYGAAFGYYGLNSIFWQNNLKAKLAKRLWCLRYLSVQQTKTNDFVPASRQREHLLSARMSTNAYSDIVAYQRRQTAEHVKTLAVDVKKLSRRDYFMELANSKIVISPFGWGEINIPRDYEVALSGSVLLKPTMDHLTTWPIIFDEKTSVFYRWDFTDLLQTITTINKEYDDYVNYAKALQKRYQYYAISPAGREDFCHYFKKIIQ